MTEVKSMAKNLNDIPAWRLIPIRSCTFALIRGHSFLVRKIFSERDFKAALGKLNEDHFELGRRAWSVICWSCLIYTICCIPIGTILLHSLRGLRGLLCRANWLNGRLGGQGLSRHQYLFEQIFVAVKTLPGGLEDFAVVVGVAG